jgi:hypothetical protein
MIKRLTICKMPVTNITGTAQHIAVSSNLVTKRSINSNPHTSHRIVIDCTMPNFARAPAVPMPDRIASAAL